MSVFKLGVIKIANYKRKKKRTIPVGRTVMVRNGLINKKTKNPKERRTHVVIETNNEDLALVRLTSEKDRKQASKLKYYLGGNSYFKHFVETEDINKNPLRIGTDITENHKNMDLSNEHIKHIKNKLSVSIQKEQYLEKMNKFRSRYKKN